MKCQLEEFKVSIIFEEQRYHKKHKFVKVYGCNIRSEVKIVVNHFMQQIHDSIKFCNKPRAFNNTKVS